MTGSGPIPLFDLGNVIIKVDFDPFIDWLASRSASGDRAHAETVLRSSLFYDFEFGNIGREEFARRLSSLYTAEFTVAEAEEAFCSIFPGLVPGMVELVRELAHERPIYCLSNTNEVHLEWIRRHHPECLESFTRIFVSHEMRQRKPYPGIYQSVAEALLAPPGDILFFDDVPANVEGAIRAGLRGHLFTEAASSREVLKGLWSSGDNV